MNTLEAIYSRKSIRNFNGKSVTETQLREILKAAYASPVGRAMYDTLLISVVTNEKLLSKWEKATGKMTGNPDLHPFYGAPTVILVSSLKNPEPGNVNYSNAAIVVQNMALAATELNVGACHIWGAVAAVSGNAELANELGVSEGFTPCCALAIGQFDGDYQIRKIAENRIKTTYVK